MSPDPPAPAGLDTDIGDVNTGGNFTEIGWSNSNNAGGAAGEGGGLFSRSELVASYSDLDLGGDVRQSVSAVTHQFTYPG